MEALKLSLVLILYWAYAMLCIKHVAFEQTFSPSLLAATLVQRSLGGPDFNPSDLEEMFQPPGDSVWLTVST